MPTSYYDYIIAGAGCAGLSLLMRMAGHPFFNHKQILVIDKAPKTGNDRTWCFWETKPGFFEPVVHHRWRQLHFYSQGFSSPVNIAPYEYKMIRGIDFYGYVLGCARQYPNIHFHYGEIESVGMEGGKGFVQTGGQQFFAGFIFNSILPVPLFQKGQFNTKGFNRVPKPPFGEGDTTLLQHFKGWLIETRDNVFDSSTATFMDFRVGQHQATCFVYVLPVAANKALVEYTLVSENVLPAGQYDAALKNYIYHYITTGPYTILEEEFGVIPMTDHRFSPGGGNIINVGTAGGQTKASSGFTFQFIQKQSTAIIQALVNGRSPLPRQPLFSSRFRLYDSILLHILKTGKMPGSEIFARLFKKIPPQAILRFLDNESSLLEELQIMAAMPAGIFLPTAIQKLLRAGTKYKVRGTK